MSNYVELCKLFLVLVGKLNKFYSFEVGEMAFPNDELIPNTVVAIILYPIKLKSYLLSRPNDEG